MALLDRLLSGRIIGTITEVFVERIQGFRVALFLRQDLTEEW
jgi:hypothetical protein